MRKKRYIPFVALALAVLMTSCVSPYYGTARIEPGWQLDTGLGLHTTLIPVLDGGDPVYGVGIRCDGEIGYGVGKYLKPYVRGAVGLNTAYLGFADAGIGFQTALPLGPIAPAVKLELNPMMGEPTFSPAFLLGIGREERVTLGARTHFIVFGAPYYPFFLDVFATAHISPRWSIFAGAEINSFIDTFDDGDGYPFFTVGAGYKFPPLRGKTRL
ncbi:hypothetical protein CEE36_09555 [candidate division TA06 bacterium B3_TA06]|uniref:Outer membrane protein beta-barrel domain-containing protein n=1 Tax=candidate division TA06 bacterium B3_TA06 TaxID=2012487 RepID=A0A532UZY7_UNCT6|nr:MAG: hypothetical protein CEE36_09555 [candidate division TA06 bacterium B3_TA06]